MNSNGSANVRKWSVQVIMIDSLFVRKLWWCHVWALRGTNDHSLTRYSDVCVKSSCMNLGYDTPRLGMLWFKKLHAVSVQWYKRHAELTRFSTDSAKVVICGTCGHYDCWPSAEIAGGGKKERRKRKPTRWTTVCHRMLCRNYVQYMCNICVPVHAIVFSRCLLCQKRHAMANRDTQWCAKMCP